MRRFPNGHLDGHSISPRYFLPTFSSGRRRAQAAQGHQEKPLFANEMSKSERW